MTQNQGQSPQGLLNPRFTLNDKYVFFSCIKLRLVITQPNQYTLEQIRILEKRVLDIHKEGISTQKPNYKLFSGKNDVLVMTLKIPLISVNYMQKATSR
jgi:hypothetical protein